ncbi:MAG: phosphoenolpyruvate carboxykinase (GTP) [Rhodobacteraceae bacterium]|nr:phosphoenolpyruvate carboxykinase (GTP) [Paracoccaceae bacterium]
MTPSETWVAAVAARCRPAQVHWCDGSEAEYRSLCATLVAQGTMMPLDPVRRPRSFLARSTPDDVARLEHRTFVCPATEKEAGPTNNWREPRAMRAELETLLAGSMAGRTMYVIPFVMAGGTPIEMFGIQVTDSAYVAASMHLMARVGADVLARMPQDDFLRCTHSVGAPLAPGEPSAAWPCSATKYIAHFPEDGEVISYGSGYGGNALLGKKCVALRLATVRGRRDGWLAEHMLVVGLESPEGEKTYVAAAFPSACGKTNFAMVRPPADMPGWKVHTIGDDIAWLFPGRAGELRAVNPETGFFGVAPGTSAATNAVAMDMVGHDCIFTNCALTEEGDVWWEGMTPTPPERLTDWQGRPWVPGCGRPAAPPNARFTVRVTNCRSLDPAWRDPEGVPLSAIVFGARIGRTFPLVFQARDWEEGILWAATMSSEATAAAEGQAQLRRDPFAMLPFCGYAITDYFAHWLAFRERLGAVPPIFRVNWFRRDAGGRFLWPGFRENTRVLRWIVERARGRGGATEGALGFVPALADLAGAERVTDPGRFAQVMAMDPGELRPEFAAQKAYLESLGRGVPPELQDRIESLAGRLA